MANYLAIVKRNLKIAAAQGDLIVRHLILPGHFDCCFRPIVGWLRANLPGVKFSLRDGYLPSWRAGGMIPSWPGRSPGTRPGGPATWRFTLI